MSDENSNAKSHQKYEEKSIEETLKDLKTNEEEGLNPSEIRERKRKYGPNTIEEEEKNPILDFLAHFWGPVPKMLEVATILLSVTHWLHGQIFSDNIHWKDLLYEWN